MRRVGVRRRPRYRYESDGLATVHYCPFVEDVAFSSLYEEMATEWWVGHYVDARWRMWLLTRLARQCVALDGNFAEFGVYRGGCAFMLLATTESLVERKLYLFDTFAGIPDAHLSDHERSLGLGGRLADTSAGYVARRLERWSGRFEMCPGDVFDTVPAFETGPLALAHVDMNTSAPTVHVLNYAYTRLVRGAIIVFDDYGYGWEDSQDERAAIDTFFADKPEQVVALPTGQGFVIKQ
jgi:hypothetical protein